MNKEIEQMLKDTLDWCEEDKENRSVILCLNDKKTKTIKANVLGMGVSLTHCFYNIFSTHEAIPNFAINAMTLLDKDIPNIKTNKNGDKHKPN